MPQGALTFVARLPLPTDEYDDHHEDEQGHDAGGNDCNNDDDVGASDRLEEPDT